MDTVASKSCRGQRGRSSPQCLRLRERDHRVWGRGPHHRPLGRTPGLRGDGLQAKQQRLHCTSATSWEWGPGSRPCTVRRSAAAPVPRRRRRAGMNGLPPTARALTGGVGEQRDAQQQLHPPAVDGRDQAQQPLAHHAREPHGSRACRAGQQLHNARRPEPRPRAPAPPRPRVLRFLPAKPLRSRGSVPASGSAHNQTPPSSFPAGAVRGA